MAEGGAPPPGRDLVDLDVARRLVDEIDWTMAQLVEFYRRGTERELAAMEQALAAGRAEEVCRRAHGAAGAGGTCGVHGMAAPLRRLETAASEGRMGDAVELLTAARRRFGEVMAVFEAATRAGGL